MIRGRVAQCGGAQVMQTCLETVLQRPRMVHIADALEVDSAPRAAVRIGPPWILTSAVVQKIGPDLLRRPRRDVTVPAGLRQMVEMGAAAHGHSRDVMKSEAGLACRWGRAMCTPQVLSPRCLGRRQEGAAVCPVPHREVDHREASLRRAAGRWAAWPERLPHDRSSTVRRRPARKTRSTPKTVGWSRCSNKQ